VLAYANALGIATLVLSAADSLLLLLVVWLAQTYKRQLFRELEDRFRILFDQRRAAEQEIVRQLRYMFEDTFGRPGNHD
jgi:hypothetical protein